MTLSTKTGIAVPNIPAAVRERWSLAGRLAVLIFVLLATVLLIFGAVAYRGVRDSALERTRQRVQTAGRELAAGMSRAPGRLPGLRRIAESDGVRRALSMPSSTASSTLARSLGTGSQVSADSVITAALRPAQRIAGSTPDTTLLAREFWTISGERRFGAGPLAVQDSVVLARLLNQVAQRDTVVRSKLYVVGDEVHVWTVQPVRRIAPPGTVRSPQLEQSKVQETENEPPPVGAFAELRRVVGTAQVERTIRGLMGEEDVNVYFTNVDAREWATIQGEPIAVPFEFKGIDTVAVRATGTDGQPHYIMQAQVEDTPWVIVVAQAERAVLERANAFLRVLVGSGMLLLVLGTLAAWWVTRRETRPLAALRDAAGDIAQGDYARRVPLDGGAEVATLAYTFNAMASRIGTTNAELEQRNVALFKANDAKARFLAVMSHELRTPLNAIGGYADLMALGIYGPVSTEQEQTLGRIGRSKDQLLHLVSDILQYSKLDAGAIIVRRETVRLREHFDAVAESLAEQCSSRDVLLVIEPTAAAVCADPARLQQVLLNLVTNAARFTDAKGTVTLSAEVRGDTTAIRVRDTGIGIAAEHLGTIFQPFAQVDTSLTRRVGGTGLGLTIVRDLTAAMGGHVAVESTVGVGSTFTVELESAAPSNPVRGARPDQGMLVKERARAGPSQPAPAVEQPAFEVL
ncbi:MAG TPA: HAMP domain-containing sensor histidine kinase [Gemmatimonas sp.]|nr:HAMP domain-containing sensor histidine kinase [Gemmatimonas sp.]